MFRSCWLASTCIFAILFYGQGGFAQPTMFSAPVSDIKWSPDGNWIAVAIAPYMTSDEEAHDYSVRIIDTATGEIVNRLVYSSSGVTSADWRPDGSMLVSTDTEVAALWDMTTMQLSVVSQPYSMPGRIVDIWSPRGTEIANISESRSKISIWNPVDGETIRILDVEAVGQPFAIAWSPDGSQLVTGHEDGTIVVWDAETGENIFTLSNHTDTVSAVLWDLNHNRIISGSWDNTIRVWDIETESEVMVLEHTSGIQTLSLNSTGDYLASGDENTICVWDLNTGEQLEIFDAASSPVDWNPNADQLAYVDDEGVLRIMALTMAEGS